jgi:hypothetical protein
MIRKTIAFHLVDHVGAVMRSVEMDVTDLVEQGLLHFEDTCEEHHLRAEFRVSQSAFVHPMIATALFNE